MRRTVDRPNRKAYKYDYGTKFLRLPPETIPSDSLLTENNIPVLTESNEFILVVS